MFPWTGLTKHKLVTGRRHGRGWWRRALSLCYRRELVFFGPRVGVGRHFRKPTLSGQLGQPTTPGVPRPSRVPTTRLAPYSTHSFSPCTGGQSVYEYLHFTTGTLSSSVPLRPQWRSILLPCGRGSLAEPLLRAEVCTGCWLGGSGRRLLLGKGSAISALVNFCVSQASSPRLSASELQRPISSGFDHWGSPLLPPFHYSAPVPAWLNVARNTHPPTRCLFSL